MKSSGIGSTSWIYYSSKSMFYRYTYFVKQQRLKDPQCLLLVNHLPKSPVSGTMVKCKSALQLKLCVVKDFPIAPMMKGVQCVNINVEEDPENVKEVFLSFLAEVCSSSKRTQDQDEQVIVNMQCTLWETYIFHHYKIHPHHYYITTYTDIICTL